MDVEGVERLRLEKERWARQEQQDKARAVEEAMKLRDRFAMAALTGLATGLHWTPGTFVHEDSIASDAYAIADEMLKAREAKP